MKLKSSFRPTILPLAHAKFAGGFVIAAILVWLGSWLSVWSDATIIMQSSTTSIKEQVLFDVRPGASPSIDQRLLVPGNVTTTAVTVTTVFTSSGSAAVASDIVGEVMIVNQSAKDQVLIATTRLALPSKPEMVVVRLKKQVTAPAGGSVAVAVYADNLDTFTELSDKRLIIPGLWQPLQEKIYAEVDKPLKKGGASVAVVSADDLKQAETALKQQAISQAVEVFNQSLSSDQSLWPKLVLTNVESASYDAAVGDQSPSFNGTLQALVSIVAFDESQFVSLVRSKIKSNSTDFSWRDINPKTLAYELEKVNGNIASVRATIEGDATPDNPQELIDVSLLAGLDRAAALQKLSEFPRLKVVDIVMRPAWRRHLPLDPGQIMIQTKN